MEFFTSTIKFANWQQGISLQVLPKSFNLQSAGFSNATHVCNNQSMPNIQRSIFASIAMMALLLAFSLGKPVHAQTFNSGKWLPNAQVRAVASDATFTYIGGDFTSVCPPNARYGAKLTTTTFIPDLNFPSINGSVTVCVPDGSGGWYLGGTFTQVGAVTRNHLAQINSSGSVTSWDPNANNTVYAITVDGTDIYVGGMFTTINGGTSRNYLAKLDNTTGTANATWDPNANNAVLTIAVSGSTVYIGGGFTSINGSTARNRLARLNNSTGTADALWNPDVSAIVQSIAISGTDMYVGGAFLSVHGYTRYRLAKFLTTESTGTPATWDPTADNVVYAVAVSGTDIYVGGMFATVGATFRNRLAKLNNTTGAADATWNPNATDPVYNNAYVNAIAISGTDIYVGGSFTSINGSTPRNRLAKLNNTNGLADATWKPDANNIINSK